MTHGGNPSWEMKPGTVLGAGRFLLIEALGQGGMGVVWLAHDQRLDEDVALKLVPPEIRTDAGALEDLRRETLRSRRLSHPNIIRLHDLNEFPGEPPFISMEFVDGQTVAGLKAQQAQRLFTWEQVRPIMRQLCDALEYAHTEKVIHRDLKPANMMLDRRGRLKLADFGLAAVASELTSRVSMKANTSGTPAYMSPQQMDGRTPRTTDDIYALGATLYELLTSKPPFYHGDIPHQVRNLPPDPIDQRLKELELSNDVPPYVGALLMACLAKDPAQRPQSAATVAEWLQLGGQSVASALATEITQRSVASEDSEPSSSKAPAATPVAPLTPVAGPPDPNDALEPAETKASGGKKWVWAVLAVLVIGGAIAVFMQPKPEANSSKAADGSVPSSSTSGGSGNLSANWFTQGPDVWHETGGVIKGEITTPQRSYLVLKDRVTGDFQIRFEYRPSSDSAGGGNHGLFYKAIMPEQGEAMARGLGIILGDGEPGNLYATGINTGNRSRLPNWRMDDWNTVTIRIGGNRLSHSINGTEVYARDLQSLQSVPMGDRIAFEIWNDPNGGHRSVEIRNFYVERPRNDGRAQTGPDGYENLFAGHIGDTDAFRGFKQASFPSQSWGVSNGYLRSLVGDRGTDLMTKSAYGDFEFEMVYEIDPEANSGIMYRATEAGANSFDTGPEMQLLGSGEQKAITRPEQLNGALYNLLPPTAKPGPKPNGGNYVKIVVRNGHVEHYLNNVKVLEYDWNDPQLRQKIRDSKFKDPGFMNTPEGFIAIQNRGGLQIRMMRIRRL